MTPGTKLAAYGLVLGVALGGGAVVGKTVGPVTSDADADDGMDTMDGMGDMQAMGETEEAEMPGGVVISQDGYTLDADDTTLGGVADERFSFRITGPDGSAVRGYENRHERPLHLIVVGADLGTYAHLHPSLDGDGTWSADLPARAPGAYRAFADFAVADGPELTLGVDLAVPGDTTVAALPVPSPTAAVDGYQVTLAGAPAAGETSEVTLSIRRDGEPVTELEPYLAAFGHLVAIRSGDLAYLHVHPLGDEPTVGASGGPEVRFAVEVLSPGDYRLFFDFQVDGTVRTAAFTVSV